MRIREKFSMKYEQLIENGPITIVAFGDSVTHGSVAGGEMNYDTVYWNRLRLKLQAAHDYVPVNMINAGIGGITAKGSIGRMEKQVFAHSPDLVIVCFGLNDVNGTLEDYVGALREIFGRCAEKNVDAIFMTPNMLNTYVPEDVDPNFKDYAYVTAEYQNNGRMDEYMQAAVKLATEMGVPVCDCYAKWKEMSKTQDTTMLLANRINHPIKEMHALFADSLCEMILGE